MLKHLLAATLVGAFAFPAMASTPDETQVLVADVEKLHGPVVAERNNHDRRLFKDSSILSQDLLKSGEDARMVARLLDGTELTLGENAELMVDEFVYDPTQEGGSLALSVKGAFLFVGGKIEGPTGGNVSIGTPVGTLGVRGTTVWGGFIDDGYGVLVLDGEVTVTTDAGAVTLNAGQGTMVYGDKAPEAAAPWPEDRTSRAVATITFPE